MSDRPRPRRILTPTDREFLRAVPSYYEGENARQSRYQRRRDIRERIVGSILDFEEICSSLSETERQKIFTEPETHGANTADEFRTALESLLQWIYLGCKETEFSFEALLRTAVRNGEEEFHRLQGRQLTSVIIDFDVEVIQHPEELASRLKRGEPIHAETIYGIPSLETVDIDTEGVDTVTVLPSGTHYEQERATIATIFREFLGIEPDIEIVPTLLSSADIASGDLAADASSQSTTTPTLAHPPDGPDATPDEPEDEQ